MPSHSIVTFQGAEAEYAFAWRAMQHGLIVSQPLSNTSYDFIVQARAPDHTSPRPGAPLLRIQVKSAHMLSHRCAYKITTQQSNKRPYRRGDIDFFAAWIAPCDAWYIVPASFIGRSRSIGFFPHIPNTRSKYERFREAWHLLTPVPKARMNVARRFSAG